MNILKQFIDLLIIVNDYQPENEANAHYCIICKRGFKTKAASAAHRRIKHEKGLP